MSGGEVNRLDAWRAQRQIWSRSAAIRRLISEGIDREERAKPRRTKA
jgi:metal-responsive CopG/Arc/MetJ family transcriptional regulator